jgi:cathepsin L
MAATFQYLIVTKGLQAASTYPLRDLQYQCKFNRTKSSATINGFGYIVGDEENLKRALAAIGPLSVGINANVDTFLSYGSGVYDDKKCDDNLTHAVGLVGYGTDYSYSPPKNLRTNGRLVGVKTVS